MIPSNVRYLIAAIFLSPILGVLFASLTRDLLLLFVIDFKSWLHNVPVFIESGVVTAIFGLVFSLPVVLFYGVPVFYFLKKVKLQTFWMFGLFGLLPSGYGVLRLLFDQDSPTESFYLYSISLYAFGGLFTAIIFWLIAVFFPLSRSTEN